MAATYEKPWKLLKEKNMKKTGMQGKAGTSGNILARMGKNEYISMESVEKICHVPDCRTDDILEFIPERDKQVMPSPLLQMPGHNKMLFGGLP